MSIDSTNVQFPTVLDRLVGVSVDGDASPACTDSRKTVSAVLQDLQSLLNTRQTSQGLAADQPEVSQSLIHYGIPDASALQVFTPQQCAQVAHQIEMAIRKFEPRVEHPQVTVVRPATRKDRALRLRITGQLRGDTGASFAWDAELETSTGHFSMEVAS